jgi:hypothetical protein
MNVGKIHIIDSAKARTGLVGDSAAKGQQYLESFLIEAGRECGKSWNECIQRRMVV